MYRNASILLVVLAASLIGCTHRPTAESPGINMIAIEPGAFNMGSNQGRDYWDESPVHKVTISRPFQISETEITVEQFRQFRPDFSPTEAAGSYAAGVSWHDAVAFCKWLSEEEGKPYRLPTEAEWEYACRAGTATLYSCGDKPTSPETPNAWGLKNMHTGVREWCLDWYGEYPDQDQVDPVGPQTGLTKVVRGGPIDDLRRAEDRKTFSASSSRASIAPAFGLQAAHSKPGEQARQGLVGIWFADPELARPKGQDFMDRLDNNWINDDARGRGWSAKWRGLIEAPHTGEVDFQMKVADGATLTIDGKDIINAWDNTDNLAGKMKMKQGQRYPIVISYTKRKDPATHLNVFWSWSGRQMHTIGAQALSHTTEDKQIAERTGIQQKDTRPGAHRIGFRVVQAPMPKTAPWPAWLSYAQQGVKKNLDIVKIGPDVDRPHFRKRYLLPTPLENCTNEEIDAVGMHPSFRRHNHSPAFEVCPNGDLLLIIYTSYHEYEPGVSLIASRLRFGADQWDMPDRLFDFAAVNDHAPMLYTEGDTMYCFWGNPQLEGGYPFNWTVSGDSGATWQPIKFPYFPGKIGPHSRQPINTALRDNNGTLYVASDGSGGSSVLWATSDNGKTWYDTAGRTNGRHTTFALLSDGTTILGMGGKNTDIDGYMPKSISANGGRTYEYSKTPFCKQGSNQRPSVLRLKSSRLFFAADFQHISGDQPEAISQRGSFVALSEDDGETWRTKKLIGTQQHEDPQRHKGANTIGYSAARQAPNGLIHLITTMNRPCLHLEMNEAWILSESTPEKSDEELMKPSASTITQLKQYREQYPDGKVKATWSGGVADDGTYLLHGIETWYYENGQKQRQANYDFGRKAGIETYWSQDGTELWKWRHKHDGSGVWMQFWPNGRKKAESTWRNLKCEGTATRYDTDGQVISTMTFVNGRKPD